MRPVGARAAIAGQVGGPIPCPLGTGSRLTITNARLPENAAQGMQETVTAIFNETRQKLFSLLDADLALR